MSSESESAMTDQSINQSSSHIEDDQSINQSVNQSINESDTVNQSAEMNDESSDDQITNQSVNQSNDEPVDQSVSQSHSSGATDHSTEQLNHQSVDETMSQSTEQSITQPTNQPISQSVVDPSSPESINQSADPSVKKPARLAALVHFEGVRMTEPFNFVPLGLLPFTEQQYYQSYSHPDWTIYQTIYLLDSVCHLGFSAIKQICDSPVLRQFSVDQCQARLMQVLALQSINQSIICNLPIPFNPYLNTTPFIPSINQSHNRSTRSTTHHDQSNNADTPARARVPRPRPSTGQSKSVTQSIRSIQGGRRKRKSRRQNSESDDDDDDDASSTKVTQSGGRSRRTAAAKRKSYAAPSDDDDLLASDDELAVQAKVEPEYVWKIEKILTERQRIVPLDDDGQPILDEEEEEKEEKEEEKSTTQSTEQTTDSTNPSTNSTESHLEKKKFHRIHREHAQAEGIDQAIMHLVAPDDKHVVITEYMIKIENQSYLHVEWHTWESMIEKFGEKNSSERLKRFQKTQVSEQAINLDRYGGEPFDPKFVIVDRVIAANVIKLDPEEGEPDVPDSEKQEVEMFLVKWQGLSYSQCTWETAEDIGDELKIAQFRRFNRPQTLPSNQKPYSKEEFDARRTSWYRESATYKGKNRLRDYQVQGLSWLIAAYHDSRNGILADEMGLGKTVQCVTFYEHLRKVEHISGPFMVIVPLATISHWKREVESWTDMNVIIYHDSVKGRETRDFMREHEFYYPNTKRIKFNILVTTYEILIADIDVLSNINWHHVTIDEGHRLKNKSSKLLECLRLLKIDRRLLLTGTPIQNNTGELWTLLNFLEPGVFNNASSFETSFGQLTEADQVNQLQQRIRPYMLRRMKESVEKSIPPKEETIIDIELTLIQKKYYRAIYEKNLSFLRAGVSRSNMPRLVNIEMELRKCCNHPFLIAGAEDKEFGANNQTIDDETYMTKLIAASGKMVLLDKLLPKMKREGHRVLIFSQFVSVLDLIQEYCDYRSYTYERLDGAVRGNEREAAIDRFVRPDSNRFLFLLSTRAGGVGLNLATADTVIIFDSDWNPQQDSQAQARAHRIGQKNKVNIYRLVTRNTYESQMFLKASKKLGLDHAVLTNLELGRAEQSVDDKASIDKILRLGAYGLFDEAGDQASREFEERNIDEILEKHAHVVTFNKGTENPEGEEAEATEPANTTHTSNTFDKLRVNKMSFSATEGDRGLDVNDSNFWEKLMGDSALAFTVPPDELLSQLTDESAYENEVSKQRFLTSLKRTVESVLAAKKAGEETPELDGLINLLIQFIATPAFRDHANEARAWLLDAERRAERKARTRAHMDEAVNDHAPKRRRRGAFSKKDEESESESESEGYSGVDSDAGGSRLVGNRIRGRSGAAMNNDVCSECWQSGSLLGCEGPCNRWFHLACLNLDEAPPADEPWQCDECSNQQHACRMCGVIGDDIYEPGEGVRCCSVARCGAFYHTDCAKLSPFTSFHGSTHSFKCPSHSCHRCTAVGEVYYAKCLNCPVVVHIKCMTRTDVRIAKKFIICESCAPDVKVTEKGKLAIEGSHVHTQAEPVRPKNKLKRNRSKQVRRSTGASERTRTTIRRLTISEREAMDPEELERFEQEQEENRSVARERARVRQRERRAAVKMGKPVRADSNSDSGTDFDSDDVSGPLDVDSDAQEAERRLKVRFQPGLFNVRILFDGEMVCEHARLPLFMSSGPRARKSPSQVTPARRSTAGRGGRANGSASSKRGGASGRRRGSSRVKDESDDDNIVVKKEESDEDQSVNDHIDSKKNIKKRSRSPDMDSDAQEQQPKKSFRVKVASTRRAATLEAGSLRQVRAKVKAKRQEAKETKSSSLVIAIKRGKVINGVVKTEGHDDDDDDEDDDEAMSDE